MVKYTPQINIIQIAMGYKIIYRIDRNTIPIDTELGKKLQVSTTYCKIFTINSITAIDYIEYEFIQHARVILL